MPLKESQQSLPSYTGKPACHDAAGITPIQEHISEEEIRSIPLSERMVQVAEIKDSIPEERIKQYTGEIRGFAKLCGLPIVFRAFPESWQPRQLTFLVNGGLGTYKTSWWAHAPYNPIDYARNATIMNREGRVKEAEFLDNEDLVYLLGELKVAKEVIEQAQGKGAVRQLCIETLESRRDDYNNLRQLYDDNETIRLEFGAAISMFCDEFQDKQRQS